MGPSNIALVKLMQADQALRQAIEQHEHSARAVRIQERRIAELSEKLKLAQTNLREQQSHSATLNLDITSREERIERFRSQQQSARNNKEYQAFLTEINTAKVDQEKATEEKLRIDVEAEKFETEIKDLSAQLEEARLKHDETSGLLAGKLAETQAEIDRLRPLRDEAAAGTPARAREAFERLDGDDEPMSALSKPDPRREEYICGVCNMGLVPDLYNRLHSRDELVFCPSCHRILYIPDDLPPELAIGSRKPAAAKKEKKEKVPKSPRAKKSGGAPATSSALDAVLASSQGESVKGAMDADHAPMECDVWIDESYAGVFKGKSVEHLERVIQFRMGEAGLGHAVRVAPKASAAVDAPAAPNDQQTADAGSN